MTKVSIIQPRTNRVSVNEQERNTIRSIGLAGGGGGDSGAAYGKANGAFTQANAAFVQANTAFAKANTANVLAFQANTNAAIAFTKANNAVAKTGDTMSGDLDMLSGNIYVEQGSIYADDVVASGQVSADRVLVSQGTPLQPLELTTKSYVDAKVAGNTKQIITTSGPTLSVNYSLSNYAIINLGHNVTAFSVTGWPTIPARLTLEIRNTGSFNITFPTGYLALGGQPVLTTGAGKKDVVVLTTAEAGANVFVHVVGQNYILL